MFYQVQSSAEPKVLGVNNGVFQVELIDSLLTEETKNMLFDFPSPEDNRLNKLLQLTGIKLKFSKLKRAKLTDFLLFTPFIWGCNFLISKKVKDLLSELQVPKNQYNLFPVTLINVSTQYYLFYIPEIDYTDYYFNLSKIYLFSETLKKKKEFLNIKNIKEFKDQKRSLCFETLTVSDRFKQNDLLSFRSHVDDFIVSEKVYNTFIKEGVTNLFLNKRPVRLLFKK